MKHNIYCNLFQNGGPFDQYLLPDSGAFDWKFAHAQHMPDLPSLGLNIDRCIVNSKLFIND
jgi:hypothetical protein